MTRIDVVSFAGGSERWKLAQLRFADQARSIAEVAEVVSLDDRDLPLLTTNHPEVMKIASSQCRGFGYWVWKPLAIQYYMKQMGSSDHLVLYADVGCELNSNPIARKRLVSRAERARESGVLAEQMLALERHWTKRDLLDFVQAPRPIRESGQISATWILLANHGRAHDLIDRWIEICTEQEFHLLDDSPSSQPEDKEFIEHRHDQSIFSLLYKQFGLPLQRSDGQWAGKGGRWRGADRPIWTLRNGSATSELPRGIADPVVGVAAGVANESIGAIQRLARVVGHS